MKQAKLIEGLRLLGKEEWISFRKYLLMYHSESSDNYRLLDDLYQKRDILDSIEYINELQEPLFASMSPKVFSNLMSRVYHKFEEWFYWYEGKKDVIQRDIGLVKIYNRRGAFGLADKTFNRVEKKLVNQEGLDMATHRELYQLYYNHYFSDNPVKYLRKGEIFETFATYYLKYLKEQSLLYLAEMHNLETIHQHDFSFMMRVMSRFVQSIESSKVSHILEQVYLLIREDNVEAFLKLKDVVFREEISRYSDLYVLAILYLNSFSLRLWNSNKITDPNLILEIQEFSLGTGVIFNTGKIPFIRFMNIVSALGYIKDSSAAYEFVEKWKHLVGDESKEAVHALSYAFLRFSEGNYDEVISQLIGVKFETEWGKKRALSLELIGLFKNRGEL